MGPSVHAWETNQKHVVSRHFSPGIVSVLNHDVPQQLLQDIGGELSLPFCRIS